jgi:hypothetical protein
MWSVEVEGRVQPGTSHTGKALRRRRDSRSHALSRSGRDGLRDHDFSRWAGHLLCPTSHTSAGHTRHRMGTFRRSAIGVPAASGAAVVTVPVPGHLLWVRRPPGLLVPRVLLPPLLLVVARAQPPDLGHAVAPVDPARLGCRLVGVSRCHGRHRRGGGEELSFRGFRGRPSCSPRVRDDTPPGGVPADGTRSRVRDLAATRPGHDYPSCSRGFRYDLPGGPRLSQGLHQTELGWCSCP